MVKQNKSKLLERNVKVLQVYWDLYCYLYCYWVKVENLEIFLHSLIQASVVAEYIWKADMEKILPFWAPELNAINPSGEFWFDRGSQKELLMFLQTWCFEKDFLLLESEIILFSQ